jgi:aminopeptidase N
MPPIAMHKFKDNEPFNKNKKQGITFFMPNSEKVSCNKKTNIMTKNIISIFTFLILITISGNASSQDIQPDVTSYHLTIEPNIDKGTIEGTVVINLQTNSDSVIFKPGKLEINSVEGEYVIGYKKINKDLIVYLSKRNCTTNKIVVDYKGFPKKGLIFDKENNQAYTSYFTSDWMVCNDSPEDKALFNLDIAIPIDKMCVASGELTNKKVKGNKVLYSYQLNTASPSYTYGFAIGKFNKAEETCNNISLKYYSLNYSSEQIKDIFKETPAMLSFFEEKSGVKYFQSTYSQVLTGKFYQEMSGYSILKDKYGEMVLQDSTETNLISHEMAHQWWGNQITCKGWNHFWLNEGMATFMSAAYNEYRFGKEVYLSNIESYHKVYEEVKARGKDRSLVFENWDSPSKDDRNLVYFKGAYVIHLLKEKLGDEAFWNAIRYYSTKYIGKTVETVDFQKALEESSGVDLDDFFNEWVYKTNKMGKPHIAFSFDDGSTKDRLTYKNSEWNSMIRKQLKDNKIQAVWFVAGKSMDSEKGRQLLGKWDADGHIIANHTYSHFNYNDSSITSKTYIEDIQKCDSLISDYENYSKIFRFPYLNGGNTISKRDSLNDFLHQNDYKQGWVTIDNAEWYINMRLMRHLKQNPEADIRAFNDYYVNNMFEMAEYYNNLSIQNNHRQIKHTILLHFNLTSALFLGDLIEKFRNEGWIIDNYEEAIKDPIYSDYLVGIPAEQSLIWVQEMQSEGFVSRYHGEDTEYLKDGMDKLGL